MSKRSLSEVRPDLGGWGLRLVVLLLAACSDDTALNPLAPAGPTGGTGTFVRMDFTRATGFFSLPFPSDARRREDGKLDVKGFPNPYENDYANKLTRAFDGGVDGFAQTGGVFFTLNGEVDPASLPSLAGSITEGASLFLIDITPDSPSYLTRVPITADFRVDPGPFGEKNMLSILPLQGLPLRPKTRYAAVVTTKVMGKDGKAIGPSVDMATLIRGTAPSTTPTAIATEHLDALTALVEAKVDRATVAGMAVFTTWDSTALLKTARDEVLADAPIALATSFVKAETFDGPAGFDGYCVYQATLPMPVFQAGVPPYSTTGGGWLVDPSGKPIKQRDEMARIVVTLPRASMPAKGFPTVLMSRTGAGGDRPLVDRGVQATNGGPAITPGTGPASNFAGAGFAGVSVDGPHGGLRNVTMQDEQFLMFNVANLDALRDNVRQSALELALQAHVLATLEVPITGENACDGLTTPDGGPAHFDTSHLALMGHSMGATITPLTFAVEPMFGAVILSGAGGSYIENVVYKQHPLNVRPLAEFLVGYDSDTHLHEHDPILTLLQWLTEPADPPVYLPPVLHAPDAKARHVLMLQGIVDSYILPPIANCTSLSFGLDLGGTALDAITPEEAAYTPLEPLLTYTGRSKIPLPASGNVMVGSTPATALVIQHPEDGIENGHEVVFQTEAPKQEYRCFLSSWLTGTPRVPEGKGEWDACP